MSRIVRIGAIVFGISVVVLVLAVTRPDRSRVRDPVEGNDWRMASAPSVVLGLESGGVPFEFVSSAVRLSDGSIVVADGLLNSRLQMFAPDGRYLGTLGRTGEGPGEFRWVISMQLGPADSLLVFDTSLQRLTIFTPDGQLQRTAQYRVRPGVAGTAGPLSSVARLTDGIWIGKGEETYRQGPPGELLRDTVAIGLVDGGLDEFRPILYLPGRLTTTTLLLGRPVYRVPPFSPEVIYTTWGKCVFASDGESRSISVHTSSGEIVTTLEGPGVPRVVTQEHLDDRLEFDLDNIPNGDSVALRRLLADEAHPTHLPFYHQILADERGRLWLQEYSPPWGAGRHWYVISQGGDVLGEVHMPKRMEVYEIRDDGVLGRTYGELGEHRVELFQIADQPANATRPLPQCVAGPLEP